MTTSPRPWYFDGRDIFSTGPTDDTGGHRLVVPLPNTFHPSQRVSDADAELIVRAVNEHDALLEFWHAWWIRETQTCDFDLHAEIVERFRRATDALLALDPPPHDDFPPGFVWSEEEGHPVYKGDES